jgi:hypothetical protein
MSMTAPQRDFIDALAAQVQDLTRQARVNAENIAALSESTANLKETVERLWSGADEDRQRGDDCRQHVDAALMGLRVDLNSAVNRAQGRAQTWTIIGKAATVLSAAAGATYGLIHLFA